MPLEVGRVHCIHSGQIFAWCMLQPNIKQKNAMERMIFAVAPNVAVVVERTEHELKNVTYKYKVIIAIANAIF